MLVGSASALLVFLLSRLVSRNVGGRYPEFTIRTMVTSQLCANAPNHAAVTYRDFERVERDVYRALSF